MTRNWIRALLVLAFALRGAAYGADAESILKAAGVRGGLVVHLGCGDGRLTAALLASDSYVVHGLDTDPAKVAQARERIRKLGLYGKVSVDAFDGGSPPTGGELGSLPASGKLRPPASGGHLPYVDSLVNLVVASGKCQVSSEEIARVLAPRGVLLAADGSLDTRPGRRRPALTLDTRPPAGLSGWSQFTKPVPQEIDEWTHFLHGPDNNALAEDRVAGPPRHMQWLAGPQWTRHHHSDKGTNPTIRAVVSARGRLFYMVDEAGTSNMKAPSRWMLAARDGFSGVLLWKKPLQVADSARRLELVWRTLIADGDEIYAPLGPDQPLSALDAATGAAVRTYPGTAALQEAIKDGNSLLVVSQQQTLLALRADSGKRLWQWEPQAEGAIVPLTLAAADGKVFVKTDRSVVCLSADGGKRLWRTPLAGPQKKIKLRWPRERLLVRDGVVLCSYGGTDPKVLDRDKYEYLGSHPRVREYAGKLAALSADDGRVLWRSPYMPGLESMPGEIYISEGVVWLGPDFAQPRDLRTGAVKRTRAVLERLWTDGHHYRCYPGKATSRYVITAKRGIEMFDLTGEDHARNNWVRATCRVGITPCNGLIYAPPHSCGCYMEAKLSGFWALAPKGRFQVPGSGFREERLEKGSAYLAGPKPETRNPEPRSWWTYRGDVARSGSTASALPTELKPLWSAKVGGRLSSVTAADGKLFVADVDAHTVHARDARSGKALWRFAAGGRVDSPPTLVGGLALFGSRDGWVYCLRASDGALAWRFLAAPERMSAVAYEQIESLWPLHGSVLVCDGIAYVAAGRSSYVDGGIVLYGLDPATGKVRCTTRLASEHTGALDPPAEEQRSKMAARFSQNATDYKTFLAADRSDAFSMHGALPDVMTAEGGSIFMRHLRFDGKLVRQDKKRAHLFSTTSLLDGAEHHRSYLVLGTGDFSRTRVAFPWIVAKSLAVPYGLMLAFDDDARRGRSQFDRIGQPAKLPDPGRGATVWGVRRVGKGERTDHYALFAAPRPDPSAKESLLPDFAKRTGKREANDGAWSVRLPLRPRAMIRAGGALLIGGEAPNAPGKGILRVVSCSDGRTLSESPLPSPPVWDGMAAAGSPPVGGELAARLGPHAVMPATGKLRPPAPGGGRLYIALRDGSVACLGSD